MNVVGNIHLFNLAMPLIHQGRAKKVIAISSAVADADIISKLEVTDQCPYSISKAALSYAVAKFGAQYAKDGVLCMSIAPGIIDTGLYKMVRHQ